MKHSYRDPATGRFCKKPAEVCLKPSIKRVKKNRTAVDKIKFAFHRASHCIKMCFV